MNDNLPAPPFRPRGGPNDAGAGVLAVLWVFGGPFVAWLLL